MTTTRTIPILIGAAILARIVWLAAHTTFVTFAHFLLIGGIK